MILTPIAIFIYRERAIGTENVPADGPVIVAPNHFSNMDHFFAGAYMRRKMQFMAKSQLFGNPILNYIFRVGGRVPGPPRPPRRGGVQDRARDPRPRRLRAHVLRGRALAHRRARRGQAGGRPARARVGRPGRPRRDPRLARRPQVAQAAVPEGHGAVRRADHASTSSPSPRASSSSRPPSASSTRSRRCTRPSTRRAAPACSSRCKSGRSAPGSAAAALARQSAGATRSARSSVGQRSGSWLGMITACGYWLREQPQLLERAVEVWRVERARGPGAPSSWDERVDDVARDHEVAVAQAADHRLVAGRVAGRVGEADAAVAEQVEGAAEGRVGGDRASVVVDASGSRRRSRTGRARSRAGAAGCRWSRRPTRPAVRTNVAPGKSAMPEAWSRCRWVITTRRIVAGVDARAREAATGGPGRPRGAASRTRRTCRPRFSAGLAATEPWRPGVDQERARPSGGGSGRRCTGTVHQRERGVPSPSTAATRTGRPAAGSSRAGCVTSPHEQRLDGHGGALAPPGERRRRAASARRWTFIGRPG